MREAITNEQQVAGTVGVLDNFHDSGEGLQGRTTSSLVERPPFPGLALQRREYEWQKRTKTPRSTAVLRKLQGALCTTYLEGEVENGYPRPEGHFGRSIEPPADTALMSIHDSPSKRPVPLRRIHFDDVLLQPVLWSRPKGSYSDPMGYAQSPLTPVSW